MKERTDKHEKMKKAVEAEEKSADVIFGRNPVLELLKSGRGIEKLLIAAGAEGSIRKITAMAKDLGLPIHIVERPALDRAAGGGVHQGVVAYVSAHAYCEVEDILAFAKEQGDAPLVVVLDGVEDPHNLGAIMRTAVCAGAHGIIIPKRRATGVTQTAVKASAGASAYLRCARVGNLAQTLNRLKEEGLWICACDMDGGAYYDANLTGGLALVLGGEGTGVGKLIREKCDFAVSIPMSGPIGSLNVSGAAAVLLFETKRKRDGK